jgi:hypothetical protein
MYSALYYPHTSLDKPEFAKTALLLWDKVDYISPFKDFRPRYEDAVMSEAAEMLTVQHVPSEYEKHKAHTEIERLVEAGLPEWFVFDPEDENLPYQIMPDKLLPETWQMLLYSRFVQQKTPSSPGETYYFNDAYHYVMRTSLGLTIMAILADICAGNEQETITDESDNYAALTRFFTAQSAGRYGDISMAGDIAPEAERLVTISLNTLSGRAASLEDLEGVLQRGISALPTTVGVGCGRRDSRCPEAVSCPHRATRQTSPTKSGPSSNRCSPRPRSAAVRRSGRLGTWPTPSSTS